MKPGDYESRSDAAEAAAKLNEIQSLLSGAIEEEKRAEERVSRIRSDIGKLYERLREGLQTDVAIIVGGYVFHKDDRGNVYRVKLAN